LAKRRVRSPDGREWTIRISRVRLPPWPHSTYEPEDDGILGYLVGAPLFWLILPLVLVLIQMPAAAVRPLFSPVRWVEADSVWPSELKMIWKSRKDDAGRVAAHVAAKLAEGYDGLTPAGAEFVFMTKPPGLDDLDD
jgi:hypothetical protein